MKACSIHSLLTNTNRIVNVHGLCYALNLIRGNKIYDRNIKRRSEIKSNRDEENC
jgi:hypothetical protein